MHYKEEDDEEENWNYDEEGDKRNWRSDAGFTRRRIQQIPSSKDRSEWKGRTIGFHETKKKAQIVIITSRKHRSRTFNQLLKKEKYSTSDLSH